MTQLALCASVIVFSIFIAGVYQLWTRRLFRAPIPDSRKRLLASIGAGAAFATMVGVPLLIFRGQRGWSVSIVLELTAGGFILSAVVLYTVLHLAREITE